MVNAGPAASLIVLVTSKHYRMKKKILIAFLLAGLAAAVVGYIVLHRMVYTAPRSARLGQFFNDPAGHTDWVVAGGSRCGDAALIFPSDGYIGFLWDDSWRPGHRHQGIDIFSPTKTPGVTPVVAAYDGYLSRPADWKSTVIIRVPADPLQPDRQVWMYYTHMADKQGNSFIVPDFPPGTREVLVKAGTLLGYQGNYSGSAGNPTGVHLHFSIVLDDGQGSYRNELDIENTLDPSPYLGLKLNGAQSDGQVVICPQPAAGSGY